MRTEIQLFKRMVDEMPSIQKMATLTNIIDAKLNGYKDEITKIITNVDKTRSEVKDQIAIIGRYDEVICDKASKHSLDIFRNDFARG